MGTAHLAFAGERWGAMTSPEMTGSCITGSEITGNHVTGTGIERKIYKNKMDGESIIVTSFKNIQMNKLQRKIKLHTLLLKPDGNIWTLDSRYEQWFLNPTCIGSL
jgi:hypothetical protein